MTDKLMEQWMVSIFEIQDSGARQEWEGGGMRDIEEGKVDYSNLFQFFEPMGTRYAVHMTKGRNKYPDVDHQPNWLLFPANQELHDRYKRSFLRHVKQYLDGLTDEDHAAAIIFNLNGMEDVKRRMQHESA